MITRADFVQRLISASSKTTAIALDYLSDVLPSSLLFDLCLVPTWTDTDQPCFAPEFAAFWNGSDRGKRPGLSLDEVVSELWQAGRAPEWVDLGVVDEDGQHTYIEARFSRTLISDFPMGLAPFQTRGPYLPQSHSETFIAGNPISKFSLHMSGSTPWGRLARARRAG